MAQRGAWMIVLSVEGNEIVTLWNTHITTPYSSKDRFAHGRARRCCQAFLPVGRIGRFRILFSTNYRSSIV